MFTAEQRATLRALVDRIIPPDEFPGGWEAGVGDYLDRQLAGDLRAYVEVYRGGLDALDTEARAVAAAPFAALDQAAQDHLLAQIEAGAVTTPWPIDPAAFFATHAPTRPRASIATRPTAATATASPGA